MGVFRFLDKEFPEEYPIKEHYILASEKYITGHITLHSPFGKERLSIRLWQTEKDRDGLYKYIVIFSYGTSLSNTEERQKETQDRMKSFHEDGEFSKPLKKVDGYRFHGSQIEEICCLLSLRFQARFYLLFRFDDHMKIDFDWSFFPVKKSAHPTIFDPEESSGNNFNHHFQPFLESIKSIEPIRHQALAFSAYFYREALHSIGVNNNIVLTHLVSAVESLIDSERNKMLVDKLKEKIKDDEDFSSDERGSIYNAVSHIGVKKAFIAFLLNHSSTWPEFKKDTDPEWHLKITNKDSGIYSLGEILKRIYDARSTYLHEGVPIFIEQGRYDGQHFSLSRGAIIDNVSYLEEEKLPYLWVIDDLVRFSILNFINSLTPPPSPPTVSA